MTIKQAMALMLAILLLVPSALADYWRSDWTKVDPILECVKRNNDGGYTAYFGYNNAGHETVKIGLGYFNRFSPRPWERGQTTVFQPGRVVSSFSVKFDGNSIIWILNERKVTASKDSRSCHTGGSGGSGNSQGNGNSGNSEPNDQNELINGENELIQGNEQNDEDYPDEDVEDYQGDVENEENWEEQVYEETEEVPEYTTIGATLVLIGAGIYMHYKKNQPRKRSFKRKR